MKKINKKNNKFNQFFFENIKITNNNKNKINAT